MPYKNPKRKRAYTRKYMREVWYPRHRAEQIKRVKKVTRAYKLRVNELLKAFRANGCSVCPEKAPCCLDAHHRDPKKKDFSVGTACSNKMSLKKIEAELRKCACVCKNCHAKIHAGLLRLADDSGERAAS